MSFYYLQSLAYNWFLVYYFALGIIFLLQGAIWMKNPGSFASYLVEASHKEQRPSTLVKAVRFFFLFTMLSLFFSFFPFSVYELLFSLYSLMLVYVLGSLFLRWDTVRLIIQERREKLNTILFRTGALLLMKSFVIFLLCYRLIQFETSL